MPDQAPDAAVGATTAPTASTTTSSKKRYVLWGLLASTLVVAAVLGGVFGSRAADKKRRPIPIEKVTYTMVTEGLRPATVLPMPVVVQAEQTIDGAGTPVTTSNTTPTSTTASSSSSSSGNSFFESLKNMVGVSSSTPKFNPTAMVLPPGAVAVPSWKALGDATLVTGAAVASGRVVCYPKNGKELIEMASMEYNSACEVLVLVNDKFTPYSIDHTLNISRPILLLGRPINPPMLNSTNKIVRLMDIRPGGRLEARSVQFVRGFGRYVPLNTPTELNIVAGSIMRVHVGGAFTGVGCMFRERNNTREGFIHEVETAIRNPLTRSRQFGQLILVLGGTLHLNGCRSMRFRPFGNGILNAMVIGRDINVVAGFATLVAHYTYASNLYSTNFWISGAICLVMGGAVTMVGGNTINSNMMQVQLGWCCQLGAYFGVMATIGWGYTSTNGLLFRENGGQFGVMLGFAYMTGFVQGRAWGVAVVFGPGQSYAVASGLYNWHGGATCSYAISTAFFGVGGSNYIGSGQAIFNMVPAIRTVVTQSTNTAGGFTFLGGGSLTQMYCSQLGVQMIRFTTGVATDFFIGGGWGNNINNTRISIQLVNCFFGFGNQAFVGLGGAAFVRSYSQSSRRVNFGWPTTFTYTVGGNGVTSAGTKGQNLVMTKGGTTRFIFNKTSKTVTKLSQPKRQQTASPTTLGGGKWSRKTGAKGARRQVQAADTAKMGATMGGWLKNIVDATGGIDPSIDNKIVVLQTTIMEGLSKSFEPPHPDKFKSAELKARWGGYTKILADGLVDYTGGDLNKGKDGSGGGRALGEVAYKPGTISANNSDCFLSRVKPGLSSADHIGGPGKCEVNDDAEEGDNPLAALVNAQRVTTTNIMPPATEMVIPQVDTNGQPEMPNTWLLWHELVVYCRSTDPETDDASITQDCLDKDYLKEVIKGFIALNSTTQEYQITVGQSGLHGSAQLPNFTPDADGASIAELKTAITPAWNPECQGWTKYDIQVSATVPETEQLLLDVFEDFVADPSDLTETILENWDPETDLQPCGVTIVEKGEQRYPSFKAMPAFKPSTTQLMAPNVVVADDTSIIPVQKLMPGEQYKIYVQNFPKGSKVEVRLLQGLKLTGPVVATIDSFDDDGVSEVAWTAPADVDMNAATGKYYLQAFPSEFPALFAFSQVFSFKDLSLPDVPNPWMIDLKSL